MPKQLTFNQLAVRWIRFALEPSGEIELSGAGLLRSDQGIQLEHDVSGWESVSLETQALARQALRAVCCELVAAELELVSGQGLVRDGTTFRLAAEGETPLWVKP